MKLYAAARREGRGRLAEAGRFEEADGDAEVRAVDEVEDLRAEDDTARLAEAEGFDGGEVEVEVAPGAEGVAPDLTVLPEGRAQKGEVVGREPQRLPAAPVVSAGTSTIDTACGRRHGVSHAEDGGAPRRVELLDDPVNERLAGTLPLSQLPRPQHRQGSKSNDRRLIGAPLV